MVEVKNNTPPESPGSWDPGCQPLGKVAANQKVTVKSASRSGMQASWPKWLRETIKVAARIKKWLLSLPVDPGYQPLG